MRIQSLNHSTYQHLYHIVWGTKYRRKFLKPDVVQMELLASFYQSASEHPEIYILMAKTDLDHVHVQVEIAPSMAVATAVRILKANASMALKKRFTFINKMYPGGAIWSVGYFSSTNGLNEVTIRRYIENQGRRDFPAPTNQSLGFS